eukprot:1160073-Prorocentrum_minimum.AAC.1
MSGPEPNNGEDEKGEKRTVREEKRTVREVSVDELWELIERECENGAEATAAFERLMWAVARGKAPGDARSNLQTV